MRRTFVLGRVGLTCLLFGLSCSDGVSNEDGLSDAETGPGVPVDGGEVSPDVGDDASERSKDAEVEDGDAGVEGGDGSTGDAGDAGAPDGGTAPITCAPGEWTRPGGSSFSEAYADVICHRFTCGPCTFEGDLTPTFFSKLDCFEHLARTNTAIYANLVYQYDDPEFFDVDLSDLNACLNRLQACANPTVLEEACPEIDTGRQAEGACCDRRGGCGPGLACTGRTRITTGVCQPRKGVGEACTGNAYVAADCEVGLRCVSGRCAALVSRDGSCMQTFECEAGLVCAAGRCTEGQLAGQSCDIVPCASGLFCRSEVCQAWLGEGEGCDSSAVFRLSDGGCKLGLYCRDDDETCQPLPGRGASCLDARACRHARDDYCVISLDGTEGSGLCQERHRRGDDCLARFPRMCSDGLICINGTCIEELVEPLCP